MVKATAGAMIKLSSLWVAASDFGAAILL